MVSIRTDLSSNSSGSKTSHSDDPEDPEDKYRFWLLEGSSSIAQLQKRSADEWGCQTPTSQWDIIDRKWCKFVEVKVTTNVEASLSDFECKRQEFHRHAALIVIDPKSLFIRTVDHPGDFRGLSKVKMFLFNRREVMTQMGIAENPLQESSNIFDDIFVCSKFNRDN